MCKESINIGISDLYTTVWWLFLSCTTNCVKLSVYSVPKYWYFATGVYCSNCQMVLVDQQNHSNCALWARWYSILLFSSLHLCSWVNALVLDMFLSLQGAYQSTTSGKFQDAISKLRNILLNVTLLIVDSKSEISEVRLCPALLVACLLSALNEWLVDCGRAKVLHRKSEGDGDSYISVFGYVAFSHCSNTVIGPVRISSSRYIIAMHLVTVSCHLQLSCHIRRSSSWPFAENISWVSLWNWNARRCLRYVLFSTSHCDVGLGACSFFLCFYRPHLNSKNESVR